MNRIAVAAVLPVLLLLTPASTLAATGSSPPPPPPPPSCHSCPGPPPPPTPVPTPAPTITAPLPVVNVKLDTPRVPRGHAVKVAVNASTDDEVVVVVHYHRGAGTTYRARVGGSGTLVKSWKIPKSAPVGKATVLVTVESATVKVTKKLALLVTQ